MPRVVVRDQRSTQIILRPDAQTLAQLAAQVKEKKFLLCDCLLQEQRLQHQQYWHP